MTGSPDPTVDLLLVQGETVLDLALSVSKSTPIPKGWNLLITESPDLTDQYR
jgi:hypothetical protein